MIEFWNGARVSNVQINMDAYHYQTNKQLHELYEVVTSLQTQIEDLKEQTEKLNARLDKVAIFASRPSVSR